MFGFLKRAARLADAYATGKAYEQSYKIAELTTMMYLEKLYDVQYGRSFSGLCTSRNMWSTSP